MPSPDFNLRRLIRNAASGHDLTAGIGAIAADVATDVAGLVPDEHLRQALREALPLLVREVLTENRPRGPVGGGSSYHPVTPSRPGSGSTNPAVATPFNTPVPAGVGVSPPQSPRQVTGGGAPSPKYSGAKPGSQIRDAWQRHLKALYPVESGNSKQLGDCTYDDLWFIAGQRDQQADDLKASARGFRKLAALLTDQHAATVRDLPAADLMQALG